MTTVDNKDKKNTIMNQLRHSLFSTRLARHRIINRLSQMIFRFHFTCGRSEIKLKNNINNARIEKNEKITISSTLFTDLPLDRAENRIVPIRITENTNIGEV